LKLNAVLLLCLGLNPLQGQTMLNVKATGGSNTAYALSGIRKLTFPTTGNMSVSKYNGSVDNYLLAGVRYVNFNDIGTGIEAPTNDTKGVLYLYPNPVVDILTIQFVSTGSKTANVELLSIEGKLLYKGQINGTSSYQINVSQFRQGIYLCQVSNGTSIKTTKFLKQ
jgi:hypothetical protein